MKESILAEKRFNFSIRIVNLYRYLSENKKEYVLSKQLLRSGTAVGALQSEGSFAESKPDFIHKYGIAQKECNESVYWLKLLYRSDFINQKEFESLETDAIELLKIITASILTAKKSLSQKR
ncbi:MAG TPA: four helix bundle protein [Candidatus Paceibacterota bacterium]